MTKMNNGKTILITGSGKGVGSGIVLEAAKQGYNTVVHYNSSGSMPGAEKIYEEIKSLGGRSVLVKADISKVEGIEYLYSEAIKVFGGIDVLVNNAAIQYNSNFNGYTEDMIQNIFTLNLRGYVLMAQKVIPYMKQQGKGRIINISSVHAKRPTTFDPGYSMTKGAIKMFTREMAIEVAKYGISVNTIELGYVEVGAKSGNPQDVISKESLQQEPLFKFRELFAWGRCITPKDVGPIVMFLASDEAQYVNGAALRFDDASILL